MDSDVIHNAEMKHLQDNAWILLLLIYNCSVSIFPIHYSFIILPSDAVLFKQQASSLHKLNKYMKVYTVVFLNHWCMWLSLRVMIFLWNVIIFSSAGPIEQEVQSWPDFSWCVIFYLYCLVCTVVKEMSQPVLCHWYMNMKRMWWWFWINNRDLCYL